MSFSTNDPIRFLQSIEQTDPTNEDRAIALIWLENLEEDTQGLSETKICTYIREANCGNPTTTYIKQKLKNRKSPVLCNNGRYILKASARQELDEVYMCFLDVKPMPCSNSYIGMDLFENSRDYVKRIVQQMNVAYDNSLWDCVSFLARKLVEVLIIDVYEKTGKIDDIQDADTKNFSSLNSLIGRVQADFNLDGHRRSALEKIRDLGNPTAHARKFGACQSDLKKIYPDLRLICDELLHLAGQANT